MPLPNADEIARITAALVAAIAEATVHLKEFGIGGEFPEILRHARELHTLLLEELVAAEPTIDERVRGMAGAIGNNLDRLEAELNAPFGLN